MRKPATATASVGPVHERADQAIALGPLHVVDAGHERGAVSVLRPQRAHGRESEPGVGRNEFAKHHVLGVRPR